MSSLWKPAVDGVLRLPVLAVIGATALLVAGLWLGVWERTSHERREAQAAEQERSTHLALAHEQHVRLVLRALEDALLDSLDPPRKPGVGEAASPILPVARVMADGRVQGDDLGIDRDALRILAEEHRESGLPRLHLHGALVDQRSGVGVTVASRVVKLPGESAPVTLVARYDAPALLAFFGKAQMNPRDVIVISGFDGQIRARRSGAGDVFTGDLSSHPFVREGIRSPQGSVLAASPIDGIERLYAWRNLPEHRLVTGVGTATEDALAPAKERARRYFALAGALTVLAFIAAAMIVYGMLGQQRAARSLRAGERRHLDLLGMAADWYWETNRHHELTGLRRSARYPVVYPNAPDGTLAWKVPGVDPEAPWRHSLQTLMEQREAFDDLRVERQDSQGHRRISMVCARPVFDEQGRFQGYRGVGHDITAQVEAQLALEASEVRLASIIESAMDAIVICGADQRIIVFNAAAARMFGRPAQETIGAPLDILLPASFRAAHGEQMRKFGQKHSTPRTMGRGSHVWALRANGEEFPVDASISHVEVAGEPLYAVVMRDITSRLAAERTLRASEQEQRRLVETLRQAHKTESLGAIAGGIAHDFNNVVAAIMGNARLAESAIERAAGPDRVPCEEAGAYLREISRASLRARELVRRIMSFSRREPSVYACQPVGPLVAEAVALRRSTLPSGVRIALEGADGPWEAAVDGNQIHQLVMNLGTNAWQALAGGQGRICIGLACDAAAGRLVLTVADNGMGMDEATRQRMFEPFFTTKPEGQGTGLGLAVVHEIVQGHQGTIAVRSQPGAGCTIEVRLPLAAPRQAGAGEAGDGASDTDHRPAGPAPRALDTAPAGDVDGRRPHVVYVDDYDAMLFMVEASLEAQGYRVSAFARSREALDYLCAGGQPVDLVLTDHDMPELNGVELAQALRASGLTVPVVIASGYLAPEVRQAAEKAGVVSLLDKQMGMDELLRFVSNQLRVQAA